MASLLGVLPCGFVAAMDTLDALPPKAVKKLVRTRRQRAQQQRRGRSLSAKHAASAQALSVLDVMALAAPRVLATELHQARAAALLALACVARVAFA
jgi:hypothetical protein